MIEYNPSLWYQAPIPLIYCDPEPMEEERQEVAQPFTIFCDENTAPPLVRRQSSQSSQVKGGDDQLKYLKILKEK